MGGAQLGMPGPAGTVPGAAGTVRPGRPAAALGHPLRVALLDLLARRPTLTATEAARELGESSGACSFHLRQLERYGRVEEAPGARGRVRPWRLAAQPQVPGPGDEFGQLARELENEGYRRWLAGRDTAPPGWRDEAFSAVVYLTLGELTDMAAAVRSVVASFADRAHRARPAGAGEAGKAGGAGTAAETDGAGMADSSDGAGVVDSSDGAGVTNSYEGARGTNGIHGAAGSVGAVMPVGVVARMFPLLPASSDG
ncbi:MAG TPA: winged helix-turn-helix domain-containing protein [Streptosporangiaceae bacterium]